MDTYQTRICLRDHGRWQTGSQTSSLPGHAFCHMEMASNFPTLQPGSFLWLALPLEWEKWCEYIISMASSHGPCSFHLHSLEMSPRNCHALKKPRMKDQKEGEDGCPGHLSHSSRHSTRPTCQLNVATRVSQAGPEEEPPRVRRNELLFEALNFGAVF